MLQSQYMKSIGGRDGKDFIQRCVKKIFTNKFGVGCSWLGQRNHHRICDLNFIILLKGNHFTD